MSERPMGRGAVSGPLLALIATLLLCTPTAHGQSLPRRFNCGDLNGYASGEPGYELLTQTSAPAGVLLSPAPLDTVHVGGNFPTFWGFLPKKADVLSADPDELWASHRMTSLWLQNPSVLTLTGLLPTSSYRVRLELGALAPWGELVDIFNPNFAYLPSTAKKLRVELRDGPGAWRTYASDIRCSTGDKSSTFASYIGSIVPVWVLAQTDASGKLELRLSSNDTPSGLVFLAGFELHDHETLPLIYRRSAGAPLVANTPEVAPFVAAFNAGNLSQALNVARDLPDAFQRGVALAHLVGWLDGSRDGLLHLRHEAVAALQLASPSHPGAAWLLDELSSLDRALAHLSASGYEHAQPCVSEGGMGFLNTECAGQSLAISDLTHTNANAHIALRQLFGMLAPVSGTSVLAALSDWNAGTLQLGQWEPSPLVFAVAKLAGATALGMHPSVKVSASDPDAVALGAWRDAILNHFIDLGFHASDFPAEVELRLLRLWSQQQTLPTSWPLTSFQTLLTPAELAASWWGPKVLVPADVPGVPVWANRQRQAQRLMRSVAEYWLVERRQGGTFGGGLGDDVELLAQLGRIYAGRQDQSDRRALDGLFDVISWILDGSGEVQDGYFAGGMTDVEHSGEYTSNTWLALATSLGHTARAAQVGFGVSEHLRWTADPAKAFAANTNLGRLHFRSWFFTGNGPDADPNHFWDVLLNGRAVYPGVNEAHRGLLPPSHPLMADLLSWANAWRSDALETTGGKPLGWFGPVAQPTNGFGKNGKWWNASGLSSDVAELSGGVAAFQLELMRMAYHRSTDPERWRFLLPGLRMFQSVLAWEDAGQPGFLPEGGNQWASLYFKGSPRFGPLVMSHLHDLASDLTLTTVLDPQNPIAPYVTPEFLARMQIWVENEFNGQSGALKYALGDLAACGVGHTAKATTSFEGNYTNVVPYYQVLYPLLTQRVIHTDRVNLSYQGGGPGTLLASIAGTDLVEGITFEPLVRWRAPQGQVHDLAVQCNFRDYGSSTYSAFVHNFGPDTVQATLQLESGLLPGAYLVSWAPATAKCDVFPNGTVPSTTVVQKRGTGTQLQLPVPPGMNIVLLTRTGPADLSPAGHDLTVDPPQVQLLTGAAGLSLQVTARVTNPAGVAAPPSTLRIWAAPMNAQGELVALPSGATELLLVENLVPSLAASTSYQVAEYQVSHELPLDTLLERLPEPHTPGPAGTVGVGAVGGPAGNPVSGSGPGFSGPSVATVASYVLAGQGLQLRVEVLSNGLESDPLNNTATRGWMAQDMLVLPR